METRRKRIHNELLNEITRQSLTKKRHFHEESQTLFQIARHELERLERLLN